MYRDMDYRRLEKLALLGEDNEEAVGLRLAAAMRMQQPRLTQKELGRLAGVTSNAIGNATRGENFPSTEVLGVMFRIYNIDPKFLLFGVTTGMDPEQQMRMLVALEAVHSERETRSGSD